jgi:hypothetical protein
MSIYADDVYAPAPGPPTTAARAALRFSSMFLLGLALPVFLIGGWGYNAWFLAAALWLAQFTLQWALGRFAIGLPRNVAMGVAGVGMLARAWGVMIALIVSVRVAGEDVAVPAAILFAILYTVDLAVRGLLYAQSQRRPVEPRP